MAFVHSKNSRLICGTVALSAYLRGWEHEQGHEYADVSVIVDEGHRWLPGLDNGSLKLDAIYDSTVSSGSQDETLNTALGAASGSVISCAPAGFTVGNRVINLEARESAYALKSAVADAVSASSEWMSEGQLDCGVSLHDLSAETADSNSTSVDNAASSANGGAGALHVTAFSGLTNIVVKVQHSSDNSSWSDLVTFTTATGTTAERQTVTGTVNRYVRSLWDVTGTGSATFAVFFGRR